MIWEWTRLATLSTRMIIPDNINKKKIVPKVGIAANGACLTGAAGR
jgi:hypothetical protein